MANDPRADASVVRSYDARVVDRLVVATFNVRNARAFDGWNSWPFRKRATAAVISGFSADVVGLQEAYRRQLAYLATRALGGYDVVGEGRDGGHRGEHCALAARSARLEPVSQATRWFGAPDCRPGRLPGARFPRIATIGRYVDRDSGRTLAVANVHLDADHAELRATSVAQLVGWLPDDEGLVVLGDFNTDDEACLAPLREAGLHSALASDAPGTSPGFRARADGVRLDHVFVGGALHTVGASVVRARPGGRMPSDHWPVRAELSWSSA